MQITRNQVSCRPGPFRMTRPKWHSDLNGMEIRFFFPKGFELVTT